MTPIFFDTWGWVAIANKNDKHHKDVFEFYKEFLLSRGVPITSDYVLSETFTLLKSRANIDGVIQFGEGLLQAISASKIILENITAPRWREAWEFLKRFRDKPRISFCDFSSFVVMRELDIREVLTNDAHFEQVGFGFKKLF
jgi:predicted nucleic acid-binding protein